MICTYPPPPTVNNARSVTDFLKCSKIGIISKSQNNSSLNTKRPSCRGHFPLPAAFYGMKIGPFVAKLLTKNVKSDLDRGVQKETGASFGGELLLENLR